MASNMNACCIHLGKGRTLHFPQGFLNQEVLQAKIQFGTLNSQIQLVPTVMSPDSQIQEAVIDSYNEDNQGSLGKKMTPHFPNKEEKVSQVISNKAMKRGVAKLSLPSRGRRPNVVVANIPRFQECNSGDSIPQEEQTIHSFEVRVVGTTEIADDTEETAATPQIGNTITQTGESNYQQLVNLQIQEQLQESRRSLAMVIETQHSLRRNLAAVIQRQLGQGFDIAILIKEMGHVKAAFEKMEELFARHEQMGMNEGQTSRMRPPTFQSEQEEEEEEEIILINQEHIRKTPYPAEYEQVPLPDGYIIPEFIRYDGIGDPRQHLTTYKVMCGLTAVSNIHLLQQFELSLKGKALEWYQELPEDCIRTFEEMETMFLNKFSAGLSQMKITGFNLQEILAGVALADEMKGCVNTESKSEKHELMRSPYPTTRKEIGMKKVRLTLRQKLDKPKVIKREELRTVFDHMVQAGFSLPKPKRPAEANQTDHPYYCPYHRIIGHTLEDCFVFSNEVEKLYKEGKLWIPEEFLVKPAEPSVEPPDMQDPIAKRVCKGKEPI